MRLTTRCCFYCLYNEYVLPTRCEHDNEIVTVDCIPTYWSYCFWRALGFFKRGCILERVLPVKISKESVGRSFTTEYIQSEGFVTKRYQVVSLVSIKYWRTIELKYPRDVDDTTCCCQGKSLASTRGGRANKYPREVDDITSGCQERALAPTRCG
jgi:hypothetical protein